MSCKDEILYTIFFFFEKENIAFFDYVSTIEHVFINHKKSYEIIILVNGTKELFEKKIKDRYVLDYKVKVLSFYRKISPAICLKAGINESNGEIIVVCGAFQQITTKSFENLLLKLSEDIDIITPWRKKRIDPFLNRIQSKIFNYIVKKTTKSNIHDLSITIRIFRRKVINSIELYGGMYRFLPIIASNRGFKHKEIVCEHLQEIADVRLYSIREYIERSLDILILYFNIRFTKKPLRFFSSIGMFFILLGIIIQFYVFIQKIILGIPIGGRPVLLLSTLLIVLGVQASSAGLLGEIIAFVNGRKKKEYIIEKIL